MSPFSQSLNLGSWGVLNHRTKACFLEGGACPLQARWIQEHEGAPGAWPLSRRHSGGCVSQALRGMFVMWSAAAPFAPSGWPRDAPEPSPILRHSAGPCGAETGFTGLERAVRVGILGAESPLGSRTEGPSLDRTRAAAPGQLSCGSRHSHTPEAWPPVRVKQQSFQEKEI